MPLHLEMVTETQMVTMYKVAESHNPKNLKKEKKHNQELEKYLTVLTFSFLTGIFLSCK